MKVVTRKIQPEYFGYIMTGNRNYEIILDTDNIQAGDMFVLEEHDKFTGQPTGGRIFKMVTNVLRDKPEMGLMPGYCIVAFKP